MMGRHVRKITQDVLGTWTEIVGTLVDVHEDSIMISATHEYTLPIVSHELKRCAEELKRGSLIGILRMPDGSVRVRGIPHRNRMNGELVNDR